MKILASTEKILGDVNFQSLATFQNLAHLTTSSSEVSWKINETNVGDQKCFGWLITFGGKLCEF